MGNHEYCEDCGESNFHNDRPCNPKKVAARKKLQKHNKKIHDANVNRMKSQLSELGIPYKMDEYDNAIFSPDSFCENQ